MTTLEILGVDASGDFLWVSFDGGEPVDVTPADLAGARQDIQFGGDAWLRYHEVDESQVTTLILAMNAPQPIYPTVACRVCDTDASVIVEGDAYCAGHAQGIALREEQGTPGDDVCDRCGGHAPHPVSEPMQEAWTPGGSPVYCTQDCVSAEAEARDQP